MAFPLSGTTSAKCFELLSFLVPVGLLIPLFCFITPLLVFHLCFNVPLLRIIVRLPFLSCLLSYHFFCFTNRISLLLLFVPSFVGDVKSTTSVCFVLFCFWANGFKKVHACLIFRCLLSKPRFLYERF